MHIRTTAIIAALALSGLLTACSRSPDEAAQALAAAGQTAKRNVELEGRVKTLSGQLSAEQEKVATLTAGLDKAKREAQAERDAKWRARNETAGAVKAAKSATLAAHSVGVQQGSKPKPGQKPGVVKPTAHRPAG